MGYRVLSTFTCLNATRLNHLREHSQHARVLSKYIPLLTGLALTYHGTLQNISLPDAW